MKRFFRYCAMVLLALISYSAVDASPVHRRHDYRRAALVCSGSYPAPYLEYGCRIYLFARQYDMVYWNAHFDGGGAASWREITPPVSADISFQLIQPFMNGQPWSYRAEFRWCSIKVRKFTSIFLRRYRTNMTLTYLNIFVGYTASFTKEPDFRFCTGLSYTLPDVSFRIRWTDLFFPANAFVRYYFPLDSWDDQYHPLWQAGVQFDFPVFTQYIKK